MKGSYKCSITRIEKLPINYKSYLCSKCQYFLNQWYLCMECKTKICGECNKTHNLPSKCCYNCKRPIELLKPIADENKVLYSLRIKCIYHDKGCNHVGTIEHMKKHQENCEYRSYQCPNNGCPRADILLKDKAGHESICQFLELECPDCKIKFKKIDLDKHILEVCSNSQYISCVHCKRKILIDDFQSHLIICNMINQQKANLSPSPDLNCILESHNRAENEYETSNKPIRDKIDIGDETFMSADIYDDISLVFPEGDKQSVDFQKMFASLLIKKKQTDKALSKRIGLMQSRLFQNIQDLAADMQSNFNFLLNEIKLNSEAIKAGDDKLKEEFSNQVSGLNNRLDRYNAALAYKQLLPADIDIEKLEKFKDETSFLKNLVSDEMNEKFFKNEEKLNVFDERITRNKDNIEKGIHNLSNALNLASESIEKQFKEDLSTLKSEITKLSLSIQPLIIAENERLKDSFPVQQLINFDSRLYSTDEEELKNKYLYYVAKMYDNSPDVLHLKNLFNDDIIKIKLYSTNSYFNDATYHKESIYYCGGFSTKYLDTCAIVKVVVIEEADCTTHLTESKSNVSLVSTDSFIYCVGGYRFGSLNTCEYFHPEKKKWRLCSNLNSSNAYITSAYKPPYFIFSFGGSYYESLERLDTRKLENQWECIKLKQNLTNYYGCTFNINDQEILIFGGYNGPRQFMILKTKYCEIVEVNKEYVDDQFYSSKPVYYNQMIWVVSENSKKMYKIDIKSLEFEEKGIDF